MKTKKEIAKLIDETAKMHTRELLHRYGLLNGYRASRLRMGEFEDLPEVDMELGVLQDELYKRIERNEHYNFPLP